MIEIVFQNSAAISLGNAQTYGKGPYQSGAIAYMYHREDGGEASEEEITRLRQRISMMHLSKKKLRPRRKFLGKEN